MSGHTVSEQMQEYLETIYRLEEEGSVARTGEIAKHLKVMPPSVTDMVQKLEKAGYVTYEPYRGVQLTEARCGQRVQSPAQRCCRCTPRPGNDGS